jgi:hypothetical protein
VQTPVLGAGVEALAARQRHLALEGQRLRARMEQLASSWQATL